MNRLGGRRRLASPELFAHAPRHHRGGIAGQLRPGEVPIIAERGEGVFTPEQMAALGQPRLAIEFNLITQGMPQREVGRETRFEGDRWVISLLTDDVDNNGPFTRRLLAATGLRRQGGTDAMAGAVFPAWVRHRRREDGVRRWVRAFLSSQRAARSSSRRDSSNM